MFTMLMGLLLIGLCSPAHAQRRLTVDRVASTPLPVGRTVLVRVEPFDDALSLDPDVLQLSRGDLDVLELTPVRPGVATLLVLRGGMTESIVITVDGSIASRERFSPAGMAPEDGVPFWRAETTTRIGGLSKSPASFTQTVGATLGYRSKEKNIAQQTTMLAQSAGEGWGFRTLLSSTRTKRFDLSMGDLFVTPTPGRNAFVLRGLHAAIRPGDEELEAFVSVGNTRSLECCSIFDDRGEVVALAGGAVSYEGGRTQVSAGAVIPRVDPEILPLLNLQQEVERGVFRGRATVAKLGEGYTGSLSLGLQTDRDRARFMGFVNGRGAWVPSVGAAPLTESWMMGTAEHRFSDVLALGVDGNLRDARDSITSTRQTGLGATAVFGTQTRISTRYGVSLGSENGGLRPEDLRHRLQATLSSVTRRRVRLTGSSSVSLNPALGLEQAQFRAEAVSDLGPILRVGPYFWGLMNPDSTISGIGARMGIERARAESLSIIGVQSAFTADGVSLRPTLESRMTWVFSGWGSVVGGGSLSIPLDDAAMSYSMTGGLKFGGNINDVRGLVTGGGTVSGVVFVDLDGDGVFGGQDYGVQGVEVTLLDRTVVSGEGGSYKLRGLKPSSYEMEVESTGYLLRDGVMPPVQITGAKPARVDIPLVQRRRLDVRVFVDLDGDGELDVGEWGVSAEMLTVTGPEGSQIVSAPHGEVSLRDLPQGQYEVEILAPLIDDRYLPMGRTKQSVLVDSRGFRRVLFPVRPIRQIAGKLCRDVNGNGRLDGTDLCEAGLEVRLASGEVQKTGAGGRFSFEPVPVGEQSVEAGGVRSETWSFTEHPQSVVDVRLLLPFVRAPAPEPAADGSISTELIALRLDLGAVSLKVGERVDFEVTATFANLVQTALESPDLLVRDTSIVRVEHGRLVAVSEGRTRIEAVSGSVRSPPIEVDVRRLPVVGLVARPSRIEVPFGEILTVGARAIFVDGDAQDVTDRADWQCGDPAVCRVEGNGVFVAVGPGRTILRSTYLGITSQPVEVRITTGDAVPTAMAISPSTLTLGLQSTGRVYVDAELSNGRQVQLTTEVEWKTDSPDIIAVLPGGRIRPIRVGVAGLTATYKGIESEVSLIEVVPAVGLVIVPTVGAVPAGVSVPIEVFEVLADGTFAEVRKVRWSSSAPAIAQVVDGKIHTDQIGKAALVARFHGLTSLPLEVDVVGVRLSGLRASERSLLVGGGEVAYVDAIAQYDDGTETIATSVAEWTSRDPRVATVSDDGEVRAVGPGRTVLTGKWLGWSTGPIEVLVDAGVSEVPGAILVEPGSVSLSAQGRRGLAVSVLSESGRLLDADNLRWEIGDPSVAWIENNEVRAVSVGSTEVVAVRGDVRSLPVSVEVHPIVGVIANPALGRLPVGARVDLKALAVVDSGEVEELAAGVQWRSTDTGVLRIDGDGELLAFRAGTAEVIATWRGMETLPMPVQVADTDLVALSIDPSQVSIRVDEKLPLGVLAVFGDGTVADAAPHVRWTSSRPSVARASGALLEGIEPGVAEVFSTWMGVRSAPLRVTVAPVDAVGVIIDNLSEVMLVGRRVPLRATAVTADGKLLDASEQTLWGVGDGAVIRIDANGYIEALAPGKTTVVGVVGGEESPEVVVEVTDASILRIDIEPGALAVHPTDPVELRAIATLVGARAVDVTAQVDWEVDGEGVAIDRYNRLTVGKGGRARVRARIGDVRSGWAEIVSVD